VTPPRRKLIEVGLPLDAINEASAREKSIRHGHPSTLHLWWARRPLAACRAVIFAQLVDDPSSVPEEFPDEAAQTRERERLALARRPAAHVPARGETAREVSRGPPRPARRDHTHRGRRQPAGTRGRGAPLTSRVARPAPQRPATRSGTVAPTPAPARRAANRLRSPRRRTGGEGVSGTVLHCRGPDVSPLYPRRSGFLCLPRGRCRPSL
jgi:hypothetical protein